MSAVQRVVLTDDVGQAIDAAQDIDEAFALLDAATDYYVREQRPMPLEDALKTIRAVSQQVEALG